MINFMRFIAQELREIMAMLGFRTVEEMVGRMDRLRPRKISAAQRGHLADLQKILDPSCAGSKERHFQPSKLYDFQLEKTPDEQVLIPELKKALADWQTGEMKACEGKAVLCRPVDVKVRVSSTDRAFGTLLGSEITRRFGDSLPEDAVTVNAYGGGGQSFGAFIPAGLTIRLHGDANDGFGKGLSGGKLVVIPPEKAAYASHENIIIGNVALYGATSGKVYVCGVAGERFCVRNSGATAVAEGCGDHGLEYMTGGRAVILGMTGKNFAAGMSGGIAYVLDREHTLYLRMNKEMATLQEVSEKYDVAELREILEDYVKETRSVFGKEILKHFESYLPDFKRVVPHDYQNMLTVISRYEEQGISHENAVLEAFREVSREVPV